MSKTLTESLDRLLDLVDLECTNAQGDMFFDPAHMERLKEETDYLGERLGITPFQCILLAKAIQTTERNCTMRKIGQDLGMSYLQTLSRAADFNVLRDKGYFFITRDKQIQIPSEVLDALMNDRPVEKPKLDGLSSKALLRRIGIIMRQLSFEQMEDSSALQEIDHLIKVNRETGYGKACYKYFYENQVCEEERLLFYILSHLYVHKGATSFDSEDIESYISEVVTLELMRDRFEDGSLDLVKREILVPYHQDGMVDRGTYVFKDNIIKEFFSELKTSGLHTIQLTDSKDKPRKELFYNPAEGAQVEKLASLIDPDHLGDIFESMKAKGLRTGFTCLFYGAPGTGKTETVYQLARRTGRTILMADVAQLRNCYIGETEKNVRRLFMDYRTAVAEEEHTPILLFNEADALLGTRMEGATRAVDRMENSVQNILLQELEDFSGILIATTNLTENLDPAFERRFLYKIRFDKPELEPRSRIWKSQFPTLTDEEALAIAGEFPFSGGQIENVVRKSTVDGILSGSQCSYEQLLGYCREEAIGRSSRNRIGF